MKKKYSILITTIQPVKQAHWPQLLSSNYDEHDDMQLFAKFKKEGNDQLQRAFNLL